MNAPGSPHRAAMTEAAWVGFVAASTLASGFFFLKERRCDLLTIAYIGAMFYFSPLFWGRVLQSSPDLDPTVPWQVYLIATGYLLALVIAGLFPSGTVLPKPGRPLAQWYLILAVAGLIGSLISSRGAIINADKVQALGQVGYLYVLFQIAASLTCISGVIERRWWIVAGGAFLLAIDLLIGFRSYVALTALSVALVMLVRDGHIRLFTKTPTYGAASAVLIFAMLLVHTARFAIFDQLAVVENTPRTVRTQEMRGDILQIERPPPAAAETQSHPDVLRWVKILKIPLELLQRSEPSIIQATLAGIVLLPAFALAHLDLAGYTKVMELVLFQPERWSYLWSP